MTRRSHHLAKWFGHPVIIALISVIILLDLASIEKHQFGDSVVRDALLGWSDGRAPAAHGRPIMGTPIREEGEVIWLTPWEDDYDQRVKTFGVDVLPIHVFRDMIHKEGFYHLTRRVEEFFVYPYGSSQVVSKEDREAVLSAILAALEREPHFGESIRFVPDLIRAGSNRRVTTMYVGHARNAIALALWVALILNCTLGKPWQWGPLHARLRNQRTRQGLCPACGYDLSGLDDGAVCPECGLDRQATN